MPDFGGSRIDVPIDFGHVGPKIMSIAHHIAEELGRLEKELMPLAEFWMAVRRTNGSRRRRDGIVLPVSDGRRGPTRRYRHAVNTNWGNYLTVEQTTRQCCGRIDEEPASRDA
jgi:hypothetical protein